MHPSYQKILPLFSLVALLAIALIASACSGADGASDAEQSERARAVNEGTRVETMVVSPTTFEDVVEMTGTIRSLDDATLSAQSAGTIVHLAPLGTRLGSGGVAAQLDATLPRAAVDQARATVEAAEAGFALAEDNYRRQTPLHRDSIISAVEYENVKAQLNQARAELGQARAALAQAEKQLQNAAVRTPFAGVVEEHFAEQGEQVTPGTPIARVVNTSRVKVQAGVPERYAGEIEVGTPVEVRFNAYSVGVRSGTVSFVGSTIDPDSRTFRVEVELDNQDASLKPQMVTQLLLTRERLDNVLVVPRDAVLRDEVGTSVFVVRHENGALLAERRSVVLGPSYGNRLVIRSGIEPGDEVVVSGQTVLTDRDTVRIVERMETDEVASLPSSGTN